MTKLKVVAGGDHGDIAFQFGATISVELDDNSAIDFEVSVAEVICRTDSADLIEQTILPRLTKGLRTISSKMLHIYTDETGTVGCCFGSLPTDVQFQSQSSIEQVKLYVTGDLAFYAMAHGRESMSGQWCYLCKLSRAQYSNKCHEAGSHWTIELLKQMSEKVKEKGKAEHGVKKAPWWDFIPLHHYMIPLLHVLIGIGNDILDSFLDFVSEEIESLDLQEYKTRRAISLAEHKIIDTTLQRDEWDDTPDGKRLKSLRGLVNRRKTAIEKLGALITVAVQAAEANIDVPLDHEELLNEFGNFVSIDFDEVEVNDDGHDDEVDGVELGDGVLSINVPHTLEPAVKAKIAKYVADMHKAKKELEPLAEERKVIADRLKKTRTYLGLLKKNKKEFRSIRKKDGESLESKMMKVLQTIGVELTRYHGGSLNGKDIKTLTNNASFVFDEWAKILKVGKREGCTVDTDQLCKDYKYCFLLWDGAFSIARKTNPTVEDRELYRQFVDAAVHCHVDLGCSITHKVHLMWKHVEWQMEIVEGGLGDKMEDWVELQHQWGMRLRRRFRTIHDPLRRARARAKVVHRDTSPAVVAQANVIQTHFKRELKVVKIKKEVSRKEERERNRMVALKCIMEDKKFIKMKFDKEGEPKVDKEAKPPSA